MFTGKQVQDGVTLSICGLSSLNSYTNIMLFCGGQKQLLPHGTHNFFSKEGLFYNVQHTVSVVKQSTLQIDERSLVTL